MSASRLLNVYVEDVEVHRIADGCNEFSPGTEGVPVVILVLKRGPQQFDTVFTSDARCPMKLHRPCAAAAAAPHPASQP